MSCSIRCSTIKTIFCLQLLLCLLIAVPFSDAFQSSPLRVSLPSRQVSNASTRLYINFWWFSGKKEGEKTPEEENALAKGSLGGVAGMMDSMESFKKSQKVGKLTASLVQELTTNTVEGISSDGKVRIVYDLQQRPVSADIDESYFAVSDASEVANAVTAAMKDAYSRSIERMDERMKAFYTDLGLGSNE